MKKREAKKPRRPGRPCKARWCCCKCRYHLMDVFRPEPHEPGKPCRCFTFKGWICAPPDDKEDHPRAFSDWCEHGECEQFEPEV